MLLKEYHVLLSKVLNRFDTAVADRSSVEKAVLRKYYRWVKAGRLNWDQAIVLLRALTYGWFAIIAIKWPKQ